MLYRLGEVCLQLVTLNTFTSHVGATEYQDCFIESTIYQLRHFLLLILLCRHASNREIFYRRLLMVPVIQFTRETCAPSATSGWCQALFVLAPW